MFTLALCSIGGWRTQPFPLPASYQWTNEINQESRCSLGLTWLHEEFSCLKFRFNKLIRERKSSLSYWKRSLKRMEQIMLQGAQVSKKSGSKG